MCGIVSIFNIQEQTPELRQQALRMSQKIRHRGPDWSGIYCGGSAILAHERLSIVDPESGRQPLFAPDKKQVLAVNGEIYNHQNIRARFAGKYQYQTGSDCEVILSLYREMRADSDFDSLIYKGEDALHARISKMLEELNGIFAFALYDAERDEFLIARDPIGVIPLYIGYDKDGKVLEKKVGIHLAACDAYVNIAGGMKMTEPAIDLGISLAVVSSCKDIIIPDSVIAFGEIGLSGEVRAVSMAGQRVAEAKKLGFDTVILPEVCKASVGKVAGINLVYVSWIQDAIRFIMKNK